MRVIKYSYSKPIVEKFPLQQALNLLVSVSMDASIEDWEEGDEL